MSIILIYISKINNIKISIILINTYINSKIIIY